MISPRRHLQSLFRTPDDPSTHAPFLRLDKNERGVPFPPEIANRFRELLTPERIMMYPELEPLYQKIAAYVQVDREHLYLAAGSDLGIKTVYEAYIEPGDRVVLHLPTYAMQEVYSQMFQANVTAIPCTRHLDLDVERYLEAIVPGTRLVVLENPNGFTGNLTDPKAIRRIVERARGEAALVLLDEAYYLFSGQTVQPLYLEFDNVIITRSFSKDLGIAGLRCAYLLSQKHNVQSLLRVKPMHEINSAAAAFTLASLEFPDLLKRYIQEMQEGVQHLRAGLDKIGLVTSGGAGNFLVVYLGREFEISRLIDYLKNNNILVRRPFQLDAMKGWLRVGAGSVSQMDQFITVFRQGLAALGWDPKSYKRPPEVI